MSIAPASGKSSTTPVLPSFYREEVLAAFQQNQAPDFARGVPHKWVEAIDEVLNEGGVDVARFALKILREQAPDLQWPASVLEMVDSIPMATPAATRFDDDRTSDLQVVHRPGARTLVVCFCGRGHKLNIPLWIFQRWMDKLDVSVAYLRDFEDVYFLGGVRSCGSFDATVRRLRQVQHEVGADHIVCLGYSCGGYGAIRYGLELGADRIFSFGGSVNMEPGFDIHLNRAEGSERMAEGYPDVQLDLRELYLSAAPGPVTELFYGTKCWDDRIHAEHLEGLPGVVLQPMAGYDGHSVIHELIRRGEFDDVISRFELRDADA